MGAQGTEMAIGGVRLVAVSVIGGLRTGFGHTRQCGPSRSESISSTARNVR